MEALDDTGSLEFMNDLAILAAVGIFEDQLRSAGARHTVLHVLVDIAVGMTGHDNGLFPGADIGINALYQDGGAEHGSVKSCADGTVGALVHSLQIILPDTGGIGSDRGTFYCNAVFFGGFGCLDRDPVIGLVSFHKSQIIILCLEIDIGKKQIILDHLPDDTGHLISVHLHKRCLHHNPAHICYSFCCIPFGRIPQYRGHLTDISKCHI